MWRYLFLCLLGCLAACSGSKNTDGNSNVEERVDAESSLPNIQGQWMIENVVENDSSYVRPSELQPPVAAYIDFKEDNSFGVMTNCNHLGGQYVQSNDSIRLTDISTTEMACDNMEVEEKLKKVLPMVNTIDCLNDSITRLNTSKGDTYIVLKKGKIDVK